MEEASSMEETRGIFVCVCLQSSERAHMEGPSQLGRGAVGGVGGERGGWGGGIR